MATLYRLTRALVHISGPDAVTFLDGLLTQDVTKLAASRALYAALLTPQGKVVSDMLLWADNACGVLIEIDQTRAEDIKRRLTMYKLRAKVEIRDVSDERATVWSAASFDGALTDPRSPLLGWRKLAPRAEAANLPDGEAAHANHRLAFGAPDLATDANPEEVFALEALLDELNGVDFHKGCFVGQENVSRMKRRATTRKKFCPIAFEGEAMAPGSPVLAGEIEIGSVRTGAPGRALALLRLDRALEAVAAGRQLNASRREIRLDPPPWLLLPQRDGEGD